MRGNVPEEKVVDLRDSLSRLSCVDVCMHRRYVCFPYSKIIQSFRNPFSVLNATSFVIYLFTKREIYEPLSFVNTMEFIIRIQMGN